MRSQRHCVTRLKAIWRRACLSIAALAVILQTAGAGDARAPVDPLAGETVVAIWNEATLESIRETSMPAPIAARALAIVNTAMYDAWAAYDPDAVGTDGTSRLRRPSSERSPGNVRRAVAIAAFYTLRDVSAAPVADVTLAQTAQSLARGDTPERVGKAVAEAVLAFRHHDGSNQLGDLHAGPYSDYTGYRPVNSPAALRDAGRWQPLLVYNEAGSFKRQTFIVPQWGRLKPFAAAPLQRTMALGAPAAFGTPEYVRQAREIVDMSARLTDKQKAIAEYWADGMMSDSPPGHWMRFGIWVSRRDRHDIARDAKMFFTLSNALLDASIVCWNTKRRHDSERPITAIHTVYAGRKIFAWAGPGKGARWIDGSSWQPYQSSKVVTPAFPEYFSGHSTFSAAGAEVLRRFTGSDSFGNAYTQAAGASIVERGLPAHATRLIWPTFSAAAREAGLSRRYGGIHFASGDVSGREAGRRIGSLVFERAAAMFRGAPGVPQTRASRRAVAFKASRFAH